MELSESRELETQILCVFAILVGNEVKWFISKLESIGPSSKQTRIHSFLSSLSETSFINTLAPLAPETSPAIPETNSETNSTSGRSIDYLTHVEKKSYGVWGFHHLQILAGQMYLIIRSSYKIS